MRAYEKLTNVTMHSRSLAAATWVFAIARAPTASARTPMEVAAFHIDKSQNRNEVEYVVGVDASCAPSSASPVRAYWRMLERGPDATEPLTRREESLLGLERQDVDGAAVRVVLRGLPSRPVTIHLARDAAGGCSASASVAIGGETAVLRDVYVKMSFFGVSWVQLTGWTRDGRRVRERLDP